MKLRKSQVQRRKAPRRSAGWHGSYTLPRHPELASGQCRVLDVSKSGAGLELYGPWPRQQHDHELLVRLREDEDPIELRATVRNWDMTKFGFVRVGVEFTSLRAEEADFLASLTEPASV